VPAQSCCPVVDISATKRGGPSAMARTITGACALLALLICKPNACAILSAVAAQLLFGRAADIISRPLPNARSFSGVADSPGPRPSPPDHDWRMPLALPSLLEPAPICTFIRRDFSRFQARLLRSNAQSLRVFLATNLPPARPSPERHRANMRASASLRLDYHKAATLETSHSETGLRV
jgi:hypothetical protein